MKKVFLSLLSINILIFMLFILTGCNDNSNTIYTENMTNTSKVNLPTGDMNSILDYAQTVDETLQIDPEIEKVQQFNSIYSSYEGKQKGNIVKALLGKVIHFNRTSDQKLEVEMDELSTLDIYQLTDLRNNVDINKKYNITFEYNLEGYIEKIVIE